MLPLPLLVLLLVEWLLPPKRKAGNHLSFILADLATLVLTFGADLGGGGVAALGLIGQMGSPRALTSKELKPSSSSIRVEALNNCGKVWCCKKMEMSL